MKGNEARSARLNSLRHPGHNEPQLINLIHLLKDEKSITCTAKCLHSAIHYYYTPALVQCSILQIASYGKYAATYMFTSVTKEYVKAWWPLMKLT